MTAKFSYAVYFAADTGPVFIILLPPVLLTLLLIFIAFVLYCCRKSQQKFGKKKHDTENDPSEDTEISCLAKYKSLVWLLVAFVLWGWICCCWCCFCIPCCYCYYCCKDNTFKDWCKQPCFDDELLDEERGEQHTTSQGTGLLEKSEKLWNYLWNELALKLPNAAFKYSNFTHAKVHNKFVFFGYVVPDGFLRQLSLLILLLSGYAGAAFFETFLVKDTTICDETNPRLACFLSTAKMHDRPLNCSNISSYNGPNSTVECYEFVFDINGGAAAAGGIFTMASIAITAYGWIIIKISGGRHVLRWRCIATFSFQFASVFVMSATAFLPLLVSNYTPNLYLNVCAFWLIALCAINMPWMQFHKEDRVHSSLTSYATLRNTSNGEENANIQLEQPARNFGATVNS